MLAANNSEQNKLNNSVCSPSEQHATGTDGAKNDDDSLEDSQDVKKDSGNREQNIVLNLDGLQA